MRLVFFNFAEPMVWKLTAEDSSLFALSGLSDWSLVNPLHYSQFPIPRKSSDPPLQVSAKQYLLINAELVFATMQNVTSTSKEEGHGLIRTAKNLLLRLRHLSGQAALPVSDSHLLFTGYVEVGDDLPNLPFDSWASSPVARFNAKYMLETAITSKQITEAIAMGDDFAAPTHETLLFDAIVAYRSDDYPRAILYAAISAEVALGSVIDETHSQILAAKDARFRVIDLHQAGGKIVRKDPIYERLQNRSDFNLLIHELSLYVLGRSLLVENQSLFAEAKRLYATRNQIVHSGGVSENDASSTFSLDREGAITSLKTAVSLFGWLGLRNDFALPKIEFVRGNLSV